MSANSGFNFREEAGKKPPVHIANAENQRSRTGFRQDLTFSHALHKVAEANRRILPRGPLFVEGTVDGRSDSAVAGDANALVRLIYQAALEPMAFTDFLDALREADPGATDRRLIDGLLDHVGLASALAERNDEKTDRPSVVSLRFDRAHYVKDADFGAEAEFGDVFTTAKAGRPLEFAAPDFRDEVEDGMRAISRGGVAKFPIIFAHAQKRCCAYLAQSGYNEFVLSIIRNRFAEEFDLSDSLLHALTPAERTVCIALFEGKTPPEIANATGIAPSTIKSHLKSVFGKLGVNRQIDLVRLLDQAFLLERELESQLYSQRTLIRATGGDEAFPQPAKRAIQSADGRTVTYRVYGRDDAPYVVYFHGSFSCGRLSPFETQCAERSGLSVVAIDRPGYGGTSRSRTPNMKVAVHDCISVMQALNMDGACALGFGKGAMFALAAALHSTQKFQRVYLCGTSLGASRQSGTLHRRAQFLDLLLRRFPAAAAMLASLFIRPQSEEIFRNQLEKIWSESEPDLDALQDPRLVAHIRESVNEALALGVDGPVYDYLSLREARLDLTSLDQPVVAWHGETDISMSTNEARAALSTVPDLRFISRAKRGQLMFHTEFDRIAQTIAGEM